MSAAVSAGAVIGIAAEEEGATAEDTSAQLVMLAEEAIFEEASVDLDDGDDSTSEVVIEVTGGHEEEDEGRGEEQHGEHLLKIKSVKSLRDPLMEDDDDDDDDDNDDSGGEEEANENIVEITGGDYSDSDDHGELEEEEVNYSDSLETSFDPSEMLSVELEEMEGADDRGSSPEVLEVLPPLSSPSRRGPGRPRNDGTWGPRRERGRGRGGGKRGRPSKYAEAPFPSWPLATTSPLRSPLVLVDPSGAAAAERGSFRRGRGRPRKEDYVTTADGRIVLVGSSGRRRRSRRSEFAASQCPFCTFKVKNVEHFKHHLMMNHSRKMKCGQCNFKTPFQLTMDNHRFAKHGIGWGRSPICCPFCTYNVYQWGRMFDHLLSHNEEDEKRGAEKLREPAAVDLPPWHILSCRGEEREAPRSQERRLSLLAKRRKGPERTICSMCETKFATASELRSHMNERYFSGPPPYACPACPFSTPVKFNLPQHFDICHRKVYDYRCGECDFVTYAKPYLRNHEKAAHEGRAKPKGLRCPHCEFRTNTRYCLEDHLRRKHPRDDGGESRSAPAGKVVVVVVGKKMTAKEAPPGGPSEVRSDEDDPGGPTGAGDVESAPTPAEGIST